MTALPAGPHDPADVLVALLELLERPGWMRDALCREHPQLRWTLPTINGSWKPSELRAMRAVCSACSVADECRRLAHETGDAYSVMAGMTPEQRGIKVRQFVPRRKRG